MNVLKVLPKKVYQFKYDEPERLSDFVRMNYSSISTAFSTEMTPKSWVYDYQLLPNNFRIFLETSIKDVLLYEDIQCEDIEIPITWTNLHDKKTSVNYHVSHTHQNSIFSAVYYFDTLSNDSITFYDEDSDFLKIYEILTKNGNRFGPTTNQVFVSRGDLIIFRSDLVHGVTDFQTQGEERRISFAFNINLIGIGSKERLSYR